LDEDSDGDIDQDSDQEEVLYQPKDKNDYPDTKWINPTTIYRGQLWRAMKKELYLEVVKRQNENVTNMPAGYWKDEIKRAKEAMNSLAPFGWIPKGYEMADEMDPFCYPYGSKTPIDPKRIGSSYWALQRKKKKKPDYGI
jgi:hypothetical protein